MTTITIDTAIYNQRRYGRPWIATVNFSQSTKGDFAFGDWTGDSRNGGEGILSIDVAPGDIVAMGQKDNRNTGKSAPEFYVVTSNRKLEKLGDKGAAYRYFLDHPDVQPKKNDAQEQIKNIRKQIKNICESLRVDEAHHIAPPIIIEQLEKISDNMKEEKS